ncbi:MAG: lamin tail domain-containing protein, partial [Bacteroidetes bacterium]|nr:lamin tail domain-containing protein [Bacteroidota bacterium]
PRLVRAIVMDSVTVRLFFNEKLDSNTVYHKGKYVVDKTLGWPVSVRLEHPDFLQVIVKYNLEFEPQQLYKLMVNDVADCSGNLIGEFNTAEFGVAEKASAKDVIINELLFDPETGGSDFVELYNRSDKIIDLKNFWIANIGEDGMINDVVQISEESYLLAPGKYVWCSADLSFNLYQYKMAEWSNGWQVKLPTFGNDSGSVIIINQQVIIDSFRYNKNMHFPLLHDVEGVSLERISFNIATNNSSNWHSAATNIGYATPGIINSQYSISATISAQIEIIPEIFTPNADGQDDFININFNLADSSAYAVRIRVYDVRGRLVKELVRNDLTGSSGSYTWDGTSEWNSLSKSGVYIIYFEAFNELGKVVKLKAVCVLSQLGL